MSDRQLDESGSVIPLGKRDETAGKFVASDPSQAAAYWQARALRAEAKLAGYDAMLTEGEAWSQAREDGLT